MRAEETIEQQKTCTKCSATKSLPDFNREKLGRYGRTAECKACLRIRGAIWRANNSERITEYSRRDVVINKQKRSERHALWRAKNPEKRKLQTYRYYYKNREAILKRNRPYVNAFYKTRPGLRFMSKQRRRQAQASAAGMFTFQQWMAKCAYWGWRCYLCGKSLTLKTVTLDHRIPLSRGGSCWPANLAPACRRCNESKGIKTDREYRDFQQVIVMAFSQL